MIEQISIQNFQAHTKTKIDFDPNITTIIGPSDIGKSAIIRALRWVCTNSPGGADFVSHGAKGTTVRLVVDGRTVTRRRSADGSINEYFLDGKEYKAFGRNVPEPIQEFLNISDTSWQGQHDAAYWFSNTPGEVSRQLNSIVNLGIIDDTMASVGKAVHRARTKLEIAETNLTQSKEEHDELAWVPVFVKDLKVVEDEAEQNAHMASQVDCMGLLIAEAHKHTRIKEKATRTTLSGDKMVKEFQDARSAIGFSENIDTLLEQVYAIQAKISKTPPTTILMDKARARYQSAKTEWAHLGTLLMNIDETRERLCQAEKELKTAKKALPKICPTCGQFWSPTCTSSPNHQ